MKKMLIISFLGTSCMVQAMNNDVRTQYLARPRVQQQTFVESWKKIGAIFVDSFKNITLTSLDMAAAVCLTKDAWAMREQCKETGECAYTTMILLYGAAGYAAYRAYTRNWPVVRGETGEE